MLLLPRADDKRLFGFGDLALHTEDSAMCASVEAAEENGPGRSSMSLPSISDRAPLGSDSVPLATASAGATADGHLEGIRRASVEVQRFVRDASHVRGGEGTSRSASEHGRRAKVWLLSVCVIGRLEGMQPWAHALPTAQTFFLLMRP